MIKVILWDIDGTLLDFEAAEKAAIGQCFASHNMGECTDEMLKRYSAINRKYWEALEKGKMTKPEILVGRFREFFETEGLPVENAESFNAEYQVRLGDTVVFCDNAYELVQKYKGKLLQASLCLILSSIIGTVLFPGNNFIYCIYGIIIGVIAACIIHHFIKKNWKKTDIYCIMNKM